MIALLCRAFSLSLALVLLTASANADWNRRISDIRIVHPPGTPPGYWRVLYTLSAATTDLAPVPAVLNTEVTILLNGVMLETSAVAAINSAPPSCIIATCSGGACGFWNTAVGDCHLVPIGGLLRCACEAPYEEDSNDYDGRLLPSDVITVSASASVGSLPEIDTSDDTLSVSVGALMPGVSICSNDSLGQDHTIPCPCGNAGAVGNGCANSVNIEGAYIAATGTTLPDTVVLSSHGMPTTAFGLYMQHDASGDQTFHDGVLCASGNLIRLRGRASVGGASQFPDVNFANDSTLELSTRGGVMPGSGAVRFYATWYRNASTTYCPPATANVTNGRKITW